MNTILDRGDFVFKPPELGCVLSLSELPGGSGKVYDRSPYGNIGSITGASWVRLPSGLWCLSFDGSDDWIDFGTPASLFTSDGTFMIWINKDGSAFGRIWGIDKPGTYAGEIDLRHGDALLRFSIYEAGGEQLIVSDADIPLDTWIHLTCIYGSQGMMMYVDAVKQADTNTSTQGTAAQAEFVVGALTNDGTSSWKGKLAFPRVYNRVLSAFEIQNHFDREKHLFGRW